MQKQDNTHIVFVYGTLKKGQGNHHLLKDSVHVGNAAYYGGDLRSAGGFPVLFSGGTQVVCGECYRIDDRTLARLDRLEGNGQMYQRELVSVTYNPSGIATDCSRTAWMYFGVHECWDKQNLPRIDKW